MSSRSKHFRNALLGASAIVSVAALASPAAAAAQAVTFDMPAQPLTQALKAFGATADQQLIYSEKLVSGRTAPALKGEYSPEQALGILLAGSGLTAERTPGGVVTIRSAASDPQSGSAAGDGAEVEALIVTAQKREEDIQDVPIAISAFTQEALERSQIAGGPDLITQVPNMTFTKTNFSSYSIQLRGIGTQAISATTDPAVAVAFNNTPFLRNRFFEQEFYDLQRVEVLRGPQGTLYGRNATAGVVNIISAKPTFGFEAKAAGDLANYNSTRIEGMVNVPLAEDVAALRLAGAWTKRDGYAVNELTGNPIDGRDLWSTRMSLRFAPTDALDVNLIWEHFEEDDDRIRSGKQMCKKHIVNDIAGVPYLENEYTGGIDVQFSRSTYNQGCVAASLYADESFQTPNGYALPYYQQLSGLGLRVIDGLDPYSDRAQSRDLRVVQSTLDPRYSAKSDLVELQASYDLTDEITLASETAYGRDVIYSLQDYNRYATTPGIFSSAQLVPDLLMDGAFCDPQLGCSDRLVAVDVSTAKSTHFSQEFRLSSAFAGPANFSLGANFLRYDTEDKYYVFINTLTAVSISNRQGARPRHYIPNVTDNLGCMPNGMTPGDPRKIYQVDACIYVDPNPIESVNDRGHNYFLSKNPYKLVSYAAFGELYYDVTSNLKLTAGLRWTVDKKEAPQVPSWLLGGRTVGYPVAEVVRQKWEEPTGRLTLDWKPDVAFTDETLVYGSVARGYKAGGANPPPTAIITYGSGTLGHGDALLQESLLHPKTFAPEYVTAVELGAKNVLLDGELTLNAAAFYYDYEGYQISEIVDRSAVNRNFDAEVWGLELEADWRPLENLKIGFKGGYEQTRIADGMRAIDLIDRTAGDPNWIVARPFPTVPSNCILPTWLATYQGFIYVPGAGTYPNLGPCVRAYTLHLDPVTGLPYTPNPTEFDLGVESPFDWAPTDWTGYPGFDPSTAPNNGEGIAKELGGNELPNAPRFTSTISADYTIPLPNEWLLTLHGDFYYQSESWARVFNTDGYDKLKAYTNLNLAAIAVNEGAGWRVMAYVKNALDRDAITGAFLNSDDTGLTTNVFLNEPRLYGVRITKEWNGDAWWPQIGSHRSGEPYPLTLELGGMVQRHDARLRDLRPSFIADFSPALQARGLQGRDMDWGDGRDIRLTYAPEVRWWVAAGYRTGEANTDTNRLHLEEAGDSGCLLTVPICSLFPQLIVTATNYADAAARMKEEYALTELVVGRSADFMGGEGRESSFEFGMRYGDFSSNSSLEFRGVPDWQYPDQFLNFANVRHHLHFAELIAERQFKGAGPTVTWRSFYALAGNEEAGRVELDWSATGGVLFGQQKTSFLGELTSEYYDAPFYGGSQYHYGPPPVSIATFAPPKNRSQESTVPMLELSLGLSYEVSRVKVGAGYRWERYFDVLDGGYEEAEGADRTIDGPFFKVSMGFGG